MTHVAFFKSAPLSITGFKRAAVPKAFCHYKNGLFTALSDKAPTLTMHPIQ